MIVLFCMEQTFTTKSGDSARTFKHFTLNCRQKNPLEMPLTRSQQDEMEVIEQWKLSKRVDVARIQMQSQFKMLAYLDKQMHEFIALGNEKKLQRQKGNLEVKIESMHTLITSMVELRMEQLPEEPEITAS